MSEVTVARGGIGKRITSSRHLFRPAACIQVELHHYRFFRLHRGQGIESATFTIATRIVL